MPKTKHTKPTKKPSTTTPAAPVTSLTEQQLDLARRTEHSGIEPAVVQAMAFEIDRLRAKCEPKTADATASLDFVYDALTRLARRKDRQGLEVVLTLLRYPAAARTAA